MGYDRFAELLLDEKKTFLEKNLHEKTLLFFTHDPDTCAAQYEEEGKKIKIKNPLKKMENFKLTSLL